jgi:sporulation protein YlmC with PRC-barrel domain
VALLVRGSELVGLPVVTLGGDDVAEVRDVVFDAATGELTGFTLNKRSRLGGRLKETLARSAMHGLGPAAVTVADAGALQPNALAEARKPGSGNVLGDRVMTDTGVVVGIVTDVVLDTATGAVVGYEIEPAESLQGRQGRRSYLPLPDTGAVSGEALIVPAAATDYVSSDLAGFAEAVDRYRDALHGGGDRP